MSNDFEFHVALRFGFHRGCRNSKTAIAEFAERFFRNSKIALTEYVIAEVSANDITPYAAYVIPYISRQGDLGALSRKIAAMHHFPSIEPSK